MVPGGYQLVFSGQITAPPNAQTHGVVGCPGKKQPSGGGAFNESGGFPSAINSSYPSGQDWVVDINNPTSISGGFIVYAVCLAKSTKYTVVSAPAVANAGTQSTGTVVCPAGTKVTGGGAFSSSGSTAVNFNTSYPVSNGWRVDMNNGTGLNSAFTVYATCNRKMKGYSVQNTAPIANPAGAQTTASTRCPGTGTTVAIGGGAFSSSSSTSVQMNSSFPDGNGGWTVFEQNESASAT